VALVKTDVSEEPGASFIRVTKIGELGTTQAATSNRRTLRGNYLFIYWTGVESRPLIDAMYEPWMTDYDSEVVGGKNDWQRKPK
jgi:hypothetical protein